MGALDKDTWNSATAKIVVKRYADDRYVLWRDLEDLAGLHSLVCKSYCSDWAGEPG